MRPECVNPGLVGTRNMSMANVLENWVARLMRAPLAGGACLAAAIVLAAATALAQMTPVYSYGLPQPKPHISLAYPGEVVDVETPSPRPDPLSVLPNAALTVAEMYLEQTGLETTDEELYTLKKGEGLGPALRRAGYSAADANAAINAVSARVNLRLLPAGLSVRVARDGFAFAARSDREIFAMRNAEGSWVALKAIRPVERYLAYAHSVIYSSIYEAAQDRGVPDAALAEYVRVMGFSVDFQREIRRGDAFAMLYEKVVDSLSGRLIEIKLHYAGLMLSGKELGYYSFEHGPARVGWYDRNGESAARKLIRTPISGARLSSSYGMRRHPISGYNKFHQGVDFSAARGTPIIAAGSGTVTRAEWNGAYGRYIRIRHNGTYDTAYAHLSRISSDIAPGSRVEQGQIIGYVGNTGKSTGPHLHYEIIVDNKQVNPMTVSLPTGERVPDVMSGEFNAKVELVESEVLASGEFRFASSGTLRTPDVLN